MSEGREPEDPNDWFAKQFGSSDDDAPVEEAPADEEPLKGPGSAAEPSTGPLLDPLADLAAPAAAPIEPPASSIPTAFDWGFGAGAGADSDADSAAADGAEPAASVPPVVPVPPVAPAGSSEPTPPDESAAPGASAPTAGYGTLPPATDFFAAGTAAPLEPPASPVEPTGSGDATQVDGATPIVEPAAPGDGAELEPATRAFEPVASPEPVAPPSEPSPFDVAPAGPLSTAQPVEPSPPTDTPTVALPWEAPADAATVVLPGALAAPAPVADSSALDAVFGESEFREYQTPSSGTPIAASAGTASTGTASTGIASPGVASPGVASPGVASTEAAASTPRAERAPLPKSQKVLLWVASSLVAVLVLVVLFFLGTRLPDMVGSAPVVVATQSSGPSASPSPSPTVAAPVAGPIAPGVHKWDELLGAECIGDFTSPWSEKFTVVDCATPHPAQMVHRGVFPPPADAASPAPYPGVEALQAQINLLCTAPGVIDLAAAGAYNDVQFVASFPATAEQWDKGDHHYYCFVTRSSGEPLSSSVAGPQTAG
jgi:hypothetical protein